MESAHNEEEEHQIRLAERLAQLLAKKSAAKKWEPSPNLQVCRRAAEAREKSEKDMDRRSKSAAFTQKLRERTLSRSLQRNKRGGY